MSELEKARASGGISFDWEGYKLKDQYFIEVKTPFCKMMIPYIFLKATLADFEKELEKHDGDIPTNEEIAKKGK